MSKFFLFALIWWLVGNPFLAIIILLVVLYLLDRRFVGLSPSLLAPYRRNRRLSRLKRDLLLAPHNASAKLEAARLYIEKGRYAEALELLEQVGDVYDSADVVYETGLCRLKLGRIEEGEKLILQSLEMNPRVKYGEPYLRLGETFAPIDPDKAIRYLEQFRGMHSSSVEGSYKLGRIYDRLGHRAEAKRAFAEALLVYRALPRYKRRAERRWALLSMRRQIF
ncbi:hypothetical protein DLM86_19450 [Paenibacillus flagellatus]|uniref:Tetratricopeptide repeat protein n=1 Tax=Paenibacillus flagellatus TaxID=2211139 RepID=A0A2V5K209_9BACL|nr:tetratricopeptide repeat protein [Paenibacillus flagellatus]PYI53191.1 hypothetical protein DLM86_19450 [Paenibacillus flagellatus]